MIGMIEISLAKWSNAATAATSARVANKRVDLITERFFQVSFNLLLGNRRSRWTR